MVKWRWCGQIINNNLWLLFLSPFFSSLDFCSAKSARKCRGDWDSGGVMGAFAPSLPGLVPPPPPPLVSDLTPPRSEVCREPGSAFTRDSLLLWFRTFCRTWTEGTVRWTRLTAWNHKAFMSEEEWNFMYLIYLNSDQAKCLSTILIFPR